ncbi:MAG: hypothetical protein FWF96_01375, partial [Kiritimatiellaeota bacterium]|nr:hypothetical protein [Kiritimatiellota bacterium]
MRRSCFLLAASFLMAAICRGQTPATTNGALSVRWVYNGPAPGPDGRTQYLFISQELGRTNRVHMGESVGNYQLLGFSAFTRQVTLGASDGKQTLLATGDAFSLTRPPPLSAPAPVVAARQTAAPAVDARYQSVQRDSLIAFPSTASNQGKGVVQVNSFFFGNEFMYPTRYTIKAWPVTFPGSNARQYYPVAVPQNFRKGVSGVYGVR